MISQLGQSPFQSLTPELVCLVSEFWDLRDLEALELTSKACQQAARPCWRIQAAVRDILGNVPPEADARAIKALCKGAFGRQFYWDYFEGDVGTVPPIPLNFFEAALQDDPRAPGQKKGDTFQLIFIPEYITISAENYSLPIENGDDLEDLTITKKQVKVVIPADLSHMTTLTEQCLKKGFPTGFHEGSWEKTFEQHGDEHFPHWSYQRREAALLGYPYSRQKRVLEEEKLEGVSLLDRAFLNLMTYVRFRYCLDASSCVRTSTLTTTYSTGGRLQQRPSSLSWRPTVYNPLLNINDDDDFLYYVSIGEAVENFDFSIAVGVPAFPPQVATRPLRKRKLPV
jgi:hypothetical protein